MEWAATYPLLFPVALVADEDLAHALAGVLLDVLVPVADVYRLAWHATYFGSSSRPCLLYTSDAADE